MRSFALSKWYVDCVAADGRTAIAYATVLRWRGLSLRWSSIDVRDGDALLHRTSMRRAADPSRRNGSIEWRHASLGTSVACQSLQPSFESVLHHGVQWTCVAPSANVRIEIADTAPVAGLGYAEHLELGVPPWRLGIDELRWGRWIADDGAHSVVWIDWRGANPLARVFVDGVLATRSVIGDAIVEGGGVSLSLGTARVVVSRTLADVLLPIRRLAALVPKAFLRSSEEKWSGDAAATGFGAVTLKGTTMHEIVRFG
jgi:hypothetical protein